MTRKGHCPDYIAGCPATAMLSVRVLTVKLENLLARQSAARTRHTPAHVSSNPQQPQLQWQKNGRSGYPKQPAAHIQQFFQVLRDLLP